MWGKERLKRLAHRFAFIQAHAQVALRFRQRKETGGDHTGLIALACLVQRHQQLGQIRDGDPDVARPIQVFAEAVQEFQRLRPMLPGKIYSDHNREGMIQAGFPCSLRKDEARCPVECLSHLPLRQPPARSYRRQPAPTVCKSLIFFYLFKLVQRLLDSRQVSTRQIDLHQGYGSRQEQITLLPPGGVLNDRLQFAPRLFQPIPLIQHLDLRGLKVAFEQDIACHLLEQLEGSQTLLIGQAQLPCLHCRHRQPLPDSGVREEASRHAYPLSGREQPRHQPRSFSPDPVVENEAAQEREYAPDDLLVLVKLLHLLMEGVQALRI